MSEKPDSLRAADVDREFVAERLRNALNEGRLTLSEYDDRLRDTYAARTYGDLKGLLADLPTVAPAERSGLMPTTPSGLDLPEPVPVKGHTRHWIAGMWSSWLSVSLICTVIWIATGSRHLSDFWPIWVIGPWGAVLLASTITGLIGGEPRRQAEREARKRAERQARRQAERDSGNIQGFSNPVDDN